MIRLEGRILLFDVVNSSCDKIPKNCDIYIPEIVPLCWNFDHTFCIGRAKVAKDEIGLVCSAEIIDNPYISEEGIRKLLDNSSFGAGGFYNNVKMHLENGMKIIEKASLREVSLTLAPVHKEYFLKIVEGNIDH